MLRHCAVSFRLSKLKPLHKIIFTLTDSVRRSSTGLLNMKKLKERRDKYLLVDVKESSKNCTKLPLKTNLTKGDTQDYGKRKKDFKVV
ncbi:MAG: hypothetical protein BWX92_02892 [Deltaproteobacteria bacterium ADurb.Bin135]|nr:MAG: hypothetical protein BWX92_02892 [Deltaproteobacteria bacterium ADurb.Bin135]